MGESIELRVNGRTVFVPVGTSVAAAVAISGQDKFRESITGESRAPLCGMGICMECRVTLDGTAHARSCLIPCTSGMEVTTA